MSMNGTLRRAAAITFLGAFLVAGCERPPVDSVQRGYRGNGMEQVVNPRLHADLAEANRAPDVVPPVPEGGPRASEIFQNVQVLGDLSVAEFTRTMVAITNWVSPQQGCNYCHNPADMASDDPYTKRVARVMLRMTQKVNEDWKSHVAQTGVTCHTCHRGQPVPAKTWTTNAGYEMASAFRPTGQNVAGVAAVGNTSLPYDPLTPFLQEAREIRVASGVALPTDHSSPIQDTERTYGLMMHFSESLGVNCTYCHNSRAFRSWEESSPARLTAWHGIRMVREINNEFIASTTDDLPAERKGPLGDPLKAGCNTCHQGAYKPLFGVAMAPDYPALLKKMSTTPRPAAPVEAPAAEAVGPDAPAAGDAPAGAAAAEG